MAKHHFRAGFGRQPLPIQEGAIPLEKKSAPNLRDTLDGNYMKLHLHIYIYIYVRFMSAGFSLQS